MRQTDRSRVISSLDYLEKELPYLAEYEREVDWKVYQTQRSKRLEIGVLYVSLHEIQWGAGLSSVIQKEEEDSR